MAKKKISHSTELLNHLHLHSLHCSHAGDAGRPWQPNVDVINGAELNAIKIFASCEAAATEDQTFNLCVQHIDESALPKTKPVLMRVCVCVWTVPVFRSGKSSRGLYTPSTGWL